MESDGQRTPLVNNEYCAAKGGRWHLRVTVDDEHYGDHAFPCVFGGGRFVAAVIRTSWLQPDAGLAKKSRQSIWSGPRALLSDGCGGDCLTDEGSVLSAEQVADICAAPTCPTPAQAGPCP